MKISRVAVYVFIFCLTLLPMVTPRADAQTAKALLLFGGEGHKTFLGCLNCVDTSASSVCNDLGKFGSDLQANSIWNSLGKFGNDLNSESPWNDLSSDAPIIVDADGRSYGYFSTNTLHHDRTRLEWLVTILDYYEKNNDLDKTREKMCGS